jgi:hypothetical protein
VLWEHSSERKSISMRVYNNVQSGVYLRADLGVCNEMNLAALLKAAWCMVSSAHNCMCIIVI